jgi:hypothetical protein
LLHLKYQGTPTHETFQSFLQKFGVKIEDTIYKFGSTHLESILVDELLNNNHNIVGISLQVIHALGHTGRISLFHKEYGIIFGADFLFNSVFGIEGLFISPLATSIDLLTAVVAAQRVSRIKFENYC